MEDAAAEEAGTELAGAKDEAGDETAEETGKDEGTEPGPEDETAPRANR